MPSLSRSGDQQRFTEINLKFLDKSVVTLTTYFFQPKTDNLQNFLKRHVTKFSTVLFPETINPSCFVYTEAASRNLVLGDIY